MTERERREEARQFYNKWHDKGREKQEGRSYWEDFLQNILGAADIRDRIEFEKDVTDNNGNYLGNIDVYIPETNTIIEQKSRTIPLDKPQKNHNNMTPFEQAKMYDDNLPLSEKAKWIVVSNFAEIWVYDMDQQKLEPQKFSLEEIPTKFSLFNFLVKQEQKKISSSEMEISVKAGEFVGKLYDAFHKEYLNPDSEDSLKSLNMLCVRLVFCLYAEDAHIFGDSGSMFHDYLEKFETKDIRKALIELFKTLDTKMEDRDPYDTSDVNKFPYVNGGLFEKEDIEIPNFTEEIRDILLTKASEGFDWSQISPTIFGAVFESTLNPETRRSGGMHYTSIENIHKVIDPLFLDDLKAEYDSIFYDNSASIGYTEDEKKKLEELEKEEKQARLVSDQVKIREIEKQVTSIKAKRRKRSNLDNNQKIKALEGLQEKLASLTFLDPACGSGNFLTETYISLRRLENQIIRDVLDLRNDQFGGQIVIGEAINPIQINISQFYGIEINDFAVTVAKTALWIAESQMMKETEDIISMSLDFLPLKTNANIHEGNALRMSWEDIICARDLSFMMGNPPFLGYSNQSEKQKDDIVSVFIDEKGKSYKGAGKLDYVAAWYFKAADYIKDSITCAAFVSTNSITQGEQVATLWNPLIKRFGISINFAHKTFVWDSEASQKAHVHCVIIGFSNNNSSKKYLYENNVAKEARNINPYLMDADTVVIESRKKALCNVSEMIYGNKPTDGGFLFLSKDEKESLINDPNTGKFIRRIYGSEEYINNVERYCLWLVNATPQDLKASAFITNRISKVREFRLTSKKEATRESASTPALFQEVRQPSTDYIIVPRVSSEKRRYIPMGFMTPDNIINDSVQFIPNATIYEFGVLISNVHMAWMRTVAGRLKSDYRYSKDIVYNNFPWPTPTDEQKKKIEETAQGILDARALYPESSLADLYDPLTMPIELQKVHAANDKAVMQAYGFITIDEAKKKHWMNETEVVAELMKMYKELTEEG